jgi:hypothetical protein
MNGRLIVWRPFGRDGATDARARHCDGRSWRCSQRNIHAV